MPGWSTGIPIHLPDNGNRNGAGDAIRGSAVRDVINAKGGNDEVHTHGGRDSVYGRDGADDLYGGLDQVDRISCENLVPR